MTKSYDLPTHKSFTLYADHDPKGSGGDVRVRPGYDAIDVLRYAEHHGITLSAYDLAKILSGNYVIVAGVEFSTEVEV